jgi:hypothetical protein
MTTRTSREKTDIREQGARASEQADWYALAYQRFAISVGKREREAEDDLFVQRRLSAAHETVLRRRS